MKPLLVATVGLPRSGKSTWAREASKHTGAPIVCPDEIRLALHGQRFVSEAEPFVWAITRVMVGALFGAGHEMVILDATNIDESSRSEWRKPGWETQWKVWTTTPHECARRAERDDRLDLLPVIERMSRRLTLPGLEEGELYAGWEGHLAAALEEDAP